MTLIEGISWREQLSAATNTAVVDTMLKRWAVMWREWQVVSKNGWLPPLCGQREGDDVLGVMLYDVVKQVKLSVWRCESAVNLINGSNLLRQSCSDTNMMHGLLAMFGVLAPFSFTYM